ncbi:MAG: NAD kinase [Hydrogenophaga sp.]|uniref:NAD kinase n=1 Tax=Hydrogenophaga sp. TaxID=1904254 RepID=UPI001D7D4897|nr:NAD kinase [Hydrogenophaga sp.]MBX3610763.1 NAD kinase [Hydrogenophaga sp.]
MNEPPVVAASAVQSSRALRFTQVVIVGKYQAPGARHVVEEIARFLQAEGCEVALEHQTAANTGLTDYPALDLAGIGCQTQLAIVVGGDGTLLGIGRQMARHGVPLVGVNQGRLGFITDIPFDGYAEALRPILHGEFQEESRSLMAASVWREGECVYTATALNDVVVNRGAVASMIELRVEIDGHFVANQRADGLIIASPTGSTAYALSAGGPLMHPDIGGWVMVPIAPHTLSNRPVVLPSHSEIAMEIVAGRDASASFDMQSFASLQHGDRIVVRRSEHSLRLLHPVGWNYFDTLRRKLHWNEGA